MTFEHEDKTGEYRSTMPLLVGEEKKFVPADALWEMQRRIHAWEQFQEGNIDEQALFEVFGNFRDTGDGVVAMLGGGAKIVPHSPALIAVTGETPLVNCGIGHVEDPYPEIDAISAKIVKKKFNRLLRRGEAKDHEGWVGLAQGKVQVVADYENAVVGVRALKGYDTTNEVLRFNMHEPTRGMSVERAARLSHFDGYCSYYLRGGVFARGLYGSARLARVAPEALGLEPRSGALGLSIDETTQHVYAQLLPFLGEAAQEQAQAVLREALTPVLAVRDMTYRNSVIDSVRTLATDYLGPKPLAELETRLDTLQRD